uniref:Fetuin B n=1 Tax=Prolemur simus TaxID=1328070 RepID=A0A8C9ACF9_PROSS
MGLLLRLALCTLALCCGAVSLPQQALGPSPLLSRGCNDSDVLAVAGFALQDINRDRKDGYVLSLNRVNNAWEHRQARWPGISVLSHTGCVRDRLPCAQQEGVEGLWVEVLA